MGLGPAGFRDALQYKDLLRELGGDIDGPRDYIKWPEDMTALRDRLKPGAFLDFVALVVRTENPLDKRIPYNAWISPTGEVIRCSLWGHAEYAIDLLKDRYNVDYYEVKSTDNPSTMLHDKGWARIFTLSESSVTEIAHHRKPSKGIYEGVYKAYLESGIHKLKAWLIEERWL